MLDLIEDSEQINRVAPVKSEHSCSDRRGFRFLLLWSDSVHLAFGRHLWNDRDHCTTT